MNNKIIKYIKKFIYFFVSKKVLLAIVIFLLILLLKSNVFAYEYTSSGNNFNIPNEILSAFVSKSEYNDNYFALLFYYNNNWEGYFVPKADNDSGLYIQCNGANVSFRKYPGGGYPTLTNLHFYQDIRNENPVISSNHNLQLLYINQSSPYQVASNQIMYVSYGQQTIFSFPLQYDPRIEPYIMNTALELANLDTTDLTIDSGNLNLVDNSIIFKINTRPRGSYNGTAVYSTELNPSSEFYNANGVNGAYYDIPVSIFKDFLTADYEISYYLEWRETSSPARRDNSEITVIYNPQAETVDDIELLNVSISNNFNRLNNTITSLFREMEEKDQQRFLQQIEISQQIAGNMGEISDLLKDGSFDGTNIFLPDDNNPDITQNGLNTLFTVIYNAFTTGQPTDIVFPVPFTDKNITLSPYYLQDILNNNDFQAINTLIEVFWWYIICAYIIKDVAEKIKKIKSGDIENIENSNIKEEML